MAIELGPLTCHDSTIVSAAYGFIAATAQDQSFTGLFPWRWQDSSWRLSDPGDLGPSQEITKDVSPKFTKERSPYPKNTFDLPVP
jgi:hypothetical protein